MRGKTRRIAAWLGAVALPIVAALVFGLTATSRPIPDLRAYEAGPERKAQFFEYMRPLIAAENERIRSERERLTAIAEKSQPSWLDRWRLASLAREYGVDAEELSEPELIEKLLRRVDVVPMSLALAQSAKESGWGTSRFARGGNNLFGEWCFEAGCGMVPKNRVEGRRHMVEVFDSPRESVQSYLHNLNTHDRYREFRRERERLRSADDALSGPRLAEKLAQYSERRDDYVEDIKSLIRVNKLTDVVAPLARERRPDAGG